MWSEFSLMLSSTNRLLLTNHSVASSHTHRIPPTTACPFPKVRLMNGTRSACYLKYDTLSSPRSRAKPPCHTTRQLSAALLRKTPSPHSPRYFPPVFHSPKKVIGWWSRTLIGSPELFFPLGIGQPLSFTIFLKAWEQEPHGYILSGLLESRYSETAYVRGVKHKAQGPDVAGPGLLLGLRAPDVRERGQDKL